jgi:hypothetical protein
LVAALSGLFGGGGKKLLRAADKGDASAVQRLLRSGALCDARDADGMTPLHKLVTGWQPARGAQYVACAQALLAAGASPVAASSQGHTPLFLAADRGITQLQEVFWAALSQQHEQQQQNQWQQRQEQQRPLAGGSLL